MAAFVAITPIKEWHARAKAEGYVRAHLRDPESAKFTDVTMIKVGGAPYAICGWVNGKNGFGGYSGPRRFFQPVDGVEGAIILPDPSERGAEDYSNVESLFATLCSQDSDAVRTRAKSIMDGL